MKKIMEFLTVLWQAVRFTKEEKELFQNIMGWIGVTDLTIAVVVTIVALTLHAERNTKAVVNANRPTVVALQKAFDAKLADCRRIVGRETAARQKLLADAKRQQQASLKTGSVAPMIMRCPIPVSNTKPDVPKGFIPTIVVPSV